MQTPDIRLLQSFVAVARVRSISGAARLLFLSQQTLSEQIRQLERAVGVPLLIRGPRGVSLTAAGERLAVGAVAVAAELEALMAEVRGTTSRACGPQQSATGPRDPLSPQAPTPSGSP